MGSVNGDHKHAFGKSKTGRVLFVDIGESGGTRCVGLFSATRIGKTDAYEGHVTLASASGERSPEAYPVRFSVPADEEEPALAAGLTACAHVSERMLMPGWDGLSGADLTTRDEITRRIRDFASRSDDAVVARHDPRVVRTALPLKHFRSKNDQESKRDADVSVIVPAPLSVGVTVGDPESFGPAWDAARKAAAPSGKVGFGPILAPEIDRQAAQDALRAVYEPTVAAADFYGGAGIRRDDPAETRLNDRAQAARALPVLAGVVASSAEMSRAVDERAALQPLIIEYTGLTKGALKRLSKITEPFFEGATREAALFVTVEDQLGVNRQSKFVVRGGLSLEQAIEHLRELPPDWVPDNNEDWKAFADILGGLAIPLSPLIGKPVKDLLSTSKGDWRGFRAALAKAADVPAEEFDRPRMTALCGEIMQMSESLARTAILPMFVAVSRRAGTPMNAHNVEAMFGPLMEKAMTAAPSIIIGRAKSPMAALLEAERRFISRDGAIYHIAQNRDENEAPAERVISEQERKMGDLAGNKAFPVLRETWTASNGYQVVPFRNEAEMAAEGKLMGHCVGGHHRSYGSSGQYHYFSVRHPDTMRDPKQRGTLRIMPISPGAEIKIGEFRSHHNAPVNAACKRAYDEWAASFLRADLDAAGAMMDEWRAWRKENNLDANGYKPRTADEVWEARLDVRVSSPTVHSDLWREWASNVLSGWPDENPEVMFRSPEVRALLSEFIPDAARFLEAEAAARKAEAANAGPTP